MDYHAFLWNTWGRQMVEWVVLAVQAWRDKFKYSALTYNTRNAVSTCNPRTGAQRQADLLDQWLASLAKGMLCRFSDSASGKIMWVILEDYIDRHWAQLVLMYPEVSATPTSAGILQLHTYNMYTHRGIIICYMCKCTHTSLWQTWLLSSETIFYPFKEYSFACTLPTGRLGGLGVWLPAIASSHTHRYAYP